MQVKEVIVRVDAVSPCLVQKIYEEDDVLGIQTESG